MPKSKKPSGEKKEVTPQSQAQSQPQPLQEVQQGQQPQREREQSSTKDKDSNANVSKPSGDHDHDQELTEESEIESRKIKEKKHDSGAADLEKVTDYAEETEINSSDLSGVRELIASAMAERLKKEKELKLIKIKKEDVEMIVNELEISAERAERALREHGGILLDTLVTLTN